MPVTPAWQAARAGLPADATAVDRASQISQFLGAHGITAVYSGVELVSPAGDVGFGLGGIDWINLGQSDVGQAFTLPAGATVLGRLTLPLSPVGQGADVAVSLYTDSAGSPGTLISSVLVPATWITQLAAPKGLAAGGPLATAWSNTLVMNDMAAVAWASPVSGAGSPALPSATSSGNYILQAGGESGVTYVASVYTIGWGGGDTIGTVLPQPSLPVATNFGTLVATPDTLVYAGGTPTLTTLTADVWAAGWDPSTGTLQSWSSQTSLPVAVYAAAGAASGETVYIVGGAVNTSGTLTTAVWYATVTNGQITGWTAGPPLPAARQNMWAGVVAGWLVAGGGTDGSVTYHTDVWYARVNDDGSLGNWQTGPPMPVATTGQEGCTFAVTSAGIVIVGGFGSGGFTNLLQTLTVTADGPARSWQVQALNTTIGSYDGNNPVGAFDNGNGTWSVFSIGPSGGTYAAGQLASVPAISVPLPVTGLTSGATYHVVLRQDGGDLNDYIQVAADPAALPTAAQTRPATGGSWTGLPNTYSLLAGVWDQTPGGNVLHLLEDSGARVTTLVWAGGSSQLLGVVEATQFPGGPLNSNPYFAGGSGAGWNGYQGTFTVTSRPPATGAVGVFLNPAAMGLSSWAAAQAVWQSWTGETSLVTRVYLGGSSSWTISSDMSAMIAAGVKMLISVEPAYNPVSASDLAALQTFCQALQTAGAVCDFAIWSEPYYSGLTSAQYIAAVQYYGPTIRAYYPLVFSTAMSSVASGNENSFYPGDAYVDKCATDCYAGAYVAGDALATAAAPADGASPPKPFGLWEFNGSPASTGQTQAQVTSFFGYVVSYFQGRIASGQPCADVVLFSGAPGESFMGCATTQNASFEGGDGNWVAAGNSTIANSTAWAHSGSASLALTAQANGSQIQAASCVAANITTEGMPVAAGDLVDVGGWFRGHSTSQPVRVGVQWYNSSGTSLSTSYGGTVTDAAAGSGVQAVALGLTAPANAAYCRGLAQVDSTVALGEVHYLDDFEMRIVNGSNPENVTTIEFGWDYRVGLWEQVFAALPVTYAGEYVNNGTAAGAMEESGAAFGVTPGEQYTVSALVYSSVATVVVGFDWIAVGGGYLATTTQTFTVTPNTWTQVTTGPLTAVASSAFAYPRIGDATPDGATIYAQAVTAAAADPGILTAVSQITWSGPAPGSVPTGIVQLA